MENPQLTSESQLSPQQLTQYAKYSWQVLKHHFDPQIALNFPKSLPDVKCCLFVSFYRNNNFQNCIGSFQQGNISKLVKWLTIQSAFFDDRYAKIKQEEFPDLKI